MPNKMPIVVSHYTKNTGYEQVVKNLVASLDKLGLRYDIEPIESLGSWRANSNYCARSIQKMLSKYPDDDVLRVDADAVFHASPKLFLQDDFIADVAAHVADFRWHPRELLGGTLFFRNKPTVWELVDEWALLCMDHRPKERNGDLLQGLLNIGCYDVTFAELPPQYCKIFDIMRDVRDPVIEHFQASRLLKRQVDTIGAKR